LQGEKNPGWNIRWIKISANMGFKQMSCLSHVYPG
jgi:hypothetical protein